MSDDKAIEKMTVLVVDDAPLNLSMINDILKENYRIVIAKSGEAALKILENLALPDLILLDIVMPGLSGHEVILKIKENARTKDIPVLFMSGLSESEQIVEGFRLGAVDYITKPFHADEVLARVGVHIALQQSKREVQGILSKTLVGSVKSLIDVIALTQPKISEQSTRLRQHAMAVLKIINYPPQEAWHVELAMLLSQIGCISMPDYILKKVRMGKALERDEYAKFIQHAKYGAGLVNKIPRLEVVSEIIENQFVPPEQLAMPFDSTAYLGSILLKLLLLYDMMVENGFEEVYAAHTALKQTRGCPENLIDAFKQFASANSSVRAERVSINKLIPGMRLGEDIRMKDGSILIESGTKLSAELIKLVERMIIQGNCVVKTVQVN